LNTVSDLGAATGSGTRGCLRVGRAGREEVGAGFAFNLTKEYAGGNVVAVDRRRVSGAGRPVRLRQIPRGQGNDAMTRQLVAGLTASALKG
jgi:hypothetical protein